jgi:hypothetical protein
MKNDTDRWLSKKKEKKAIKKSFSCTGQDKPRRCIRSIASSSELEESNQHRLLELGNLERS